MWKLPGPAKRRPDCSLSTSTGELRGSRKEKQVPYLYVNNVNLYYETGGQGVPVVFVHGGFPSLASTVNDFSRWNWSWENDFAAVFHFLCYDRRGCYRSACPEHGYDLENQALDLASLLDALHISSAHVIGSSAGGPIGLAFAALHPHRISSLTLAGTALDLFPSGDPISDLIRQLIALLEREGESAAFVQRPDGVETSLEPLWVVEEMQARGRYGEFQKREQRLTSLVQAMSEAERARAFAIELRSMQAYMRDDLANYARQVRCPALILHGSDDREVPLAWGEAMAERIAGARLQVLFGTGHSPVHRSVEGRQLVIKFLQEVSEHK